MPTNKRGRFPLFLLVGKKGEKEESFPLSRRGGERTGGNEGHLGRRGKGLSYF